jgi:hypothetical protein
VESAEAIITSRLEKLREELATARAALFPPPFHFFPDTEPEEVHKALEAIRLEAQIKALEQLQEMLAQQHVENRAQFVAIKERDERSSTQSIWLTVISSTISLILGWSLSLLGTPLSVWQSIFH